MSDFLAEVDDAMRQERMEKLWKKYGKLIIAAIVLLILGTAATSAYKYWKTEVNTKQTNAMLNILEANSFPENVNAENQNLKPGVLAITQLTAAGKYLEQDKPSEALSLFQAIIDNKAAPSDLRELAMLSHVQLSAAQETVQKPQETLNRLKTIWSNPKSPWQYHARIEAALINAHKQGDYNAARGHLKTVIDTQGLPQTLHDKASALDHIYKLKAPAEKSDDQNQTNNKDEQG